MKKVLIILIIVVIAAAAVMAVGTKVNVYQDAKGIHFADRNSAEILSEKDTKVFNEIEIKTDSANIKFVTGDYFGYEFMAGSTVDTTYSLANKKLTITQKSKTMLFNLNLGSLKSDYITIYLPEEAILNNVTISDKSGTITINKLNCENLDVSSVSGNDVINSASASVISVDKTSGNIDMKNIKAGSLYMVLNSGNLNASGMETGAVDIGQTSGNVTMAGELLGSSVISAVSGNINLNITGAKTDFNRDISVTSGNVNVDGSQAKSNQYENANAVNSLKLKSTSGNITVNFVK
jgi:DUF4097 and DUF4098 domain-containing protein YvlB